MSCGRIHHQSVGSSIRQRYASADNIVQQCSLSHIGSCPYSAIFGDISTVYYCISPQTVVVAWAYLDGMSLSPAPTSSHKHFFPIIVTASNAFNVTAAQVDIGDQHFSVIFMHPHIDICYMQMLLN